MPVLTSNASGVVDLASRLSDDLTSGRTPRQTYGARDVAFAWADGLPPILARFVSSATVDGLTFGAVHVAPSGTPAAKVARGAVKPAAVSISAQTVNLDKFAGLATIDVEDSIQAEGLMAALAATLTQSILLAFDADCMAALDAATTPPATPAGSWSDAVLGGIAQVAGNGGRPSLLVVAAADYAAAVSSPGVGYAMDPTQGVPTLFGLAVVISAALASGVGYVLDANAAQAVESLQSPVAVIDPYAMLDVNKIRLAVEAWLGFVVVAPASVAALAVSAA